jgi:Tfp pilus assembly protein PilN
MRQDADLARRTPTTPRVNLLPAALVERRLVLRQRNRFTAGFAVLLALLTLVYLYQAGRAEEARRAASREQAVTAGLAAQRAKLQPWADLQTEVADLERLQASVYAKEIRFSDILQDLATLVPDNAWLTRLGATVKDPAGGASGGGRAAGNAAAGAQGAAGSAPVPGAPGTGDPVATITLSGEALAHVDVGALVRVLDGTIKRNGRPVYLNPFFTTSQRQETTGQQATVTFSATVDVGPAAYSGRFQRPGQAGGG